MEPITGIQAEAKGGPKGAAAYQGTLSLGRKVRMPGAAGVWGDGERGGAHWDSSAHSFLNLWD